MNTGSALARFTITLSQAVTEPVQVEWFTSDGTAKAGVDYAANKGTVLFAPGETSKIVDILVYGRSVGSEDRSFFVEMLPPTNAILGASIGECIITVDTSGSTPVTSIIVPTGPQGIQGKSAYQSYLDTTTDNPPMTEAEWVESLKGDPEEIAQEVAPLIDVGNTVLTAEGTETLGRPDSTTVKAIARRIAYAAAAKIATLVLADGDNTITASSLTGDAVNFAGAGFYPRVWNGTAFTAPKWQLNPNGSITIFSVTAGNVLYAIQYDVLAEYNSRESILSVAEPGYYNKFKSFEKGSANIKTEKDALLWEGAPVGQGPYFIWQGAFPKSVPVDSSPVTTGGIADGAWKDVGNATLDSALKSPIGFTIIGGVRGQVKTSEAGGLEAAIVLALANNADVLVDNVQNIAIPIRKSLNGKDLTIKSTADGWINFTPADVNTYYQVLTFDGTGVESVTTKVKIDGGKVRGIGRAVVGITVNNVYAHYEGSEMRNISAGVNTVTAQIHLCYGAKYYNVFQQLASQDWSAGVYGYGTVPIDCEIFSVDNCIFGVTGAPLDRHAVYGSSFADGTGASRAAFVQNNSVVMRDYTTETPETTFERAFKFIGTHRVHLHNNDLVGGYGFALFTHRHDQKSDVFKVSDNRCRTFATGILIGAQDAEDDIDSPTWQMGDLILSDNDFRFTTATSGVAVGVDYKNVLRVQDKGSRYYNEAYASVNALSVYYGRPDRVRATFIDSQNAHYDGFQYIYRGEEPVNTLVDIVSVHTVSSASPSSATAATNRTIRVRSIDNSAAWKSGFTSSAIAGFSYFDVTFGRFITSAGAGTWVDDRGFQVAGLSTARPRSVPVGHIFYQTDAGSYIRWTGSTWILITVSWTGIQTFGTTAQIKAISKTLLGYGHCIYNTDTKKPAFFDDLAQAWKYADGTDI